MSDPKMTIPDAARIARTSDEKVRAALASGQLRDLRLASVQAWRRALTADAITPRRPA